MDGKQFTIRRLLASSTFRLMFLSALLFTVTSVGLLEVVKVVTGTLLDRRVDFAIDGEIDRFGDIGRLFVARIQTDREVFDRVIDHIMVFAAVVSVILGVAIGLVMARNALRRLDLINGTIEAILADKMDGRVALSGNGDEYDMLAGNLNRMLDRIDGLMAAMRDVTRNIAHDLRTPLNRLRNRLELAALGSGRGGAEENELGETIRDVDTIIATFNALLSIARIESRVPGEQFQAVPIDRVLEDVAELYRPLAEDEGLEMRLTVSPGLEVQGDGRLLFQAIANLVDNAIKHTPPGGVVSLAAVDGDGQVRLIVADQGPGIPECQRAAVLQPFVRLDASRHHPGMGLGLSLVAAIVGLHKARLEFEDNHPGLRAVIVLAKTGYPKRPVM